MGINPPAKRSFFGIVKDKVAEAVKDTETKRPTSAAKWTDALTRTPSARQQRRIYDRDIDRTTKKYHRGQKRSAQAVLRHNERQAVKVLRHFEEASGFGLGGLRAQLIQELELRGDRGHTPQEILSAAGLTPAKIQELHEELAQLENAGAQA